MLFQFKWNLHSLLAVKRNDCYCEDCSIIKKRAFTLIEAIRLTSFSSLNTFQCYFEKK